MKKTTFSQRKLFSALGILFFSAALLTGCSKSLDNDDYNYPDVPVAGLMAFNVTTDRSVGISLSGNYLTNQPLSYAAYTGAYLRVYTGERTLESRDGYTNNILTTTSAKFDSSRYYSAFVTGANGAYRNVVVNDNLDSLSGSNGQAYVRYINAIPDSVNAATVNISVNGSSVSNRTAAYGTVSAFTAVAPGQVNIAVSKSGVNKDRTLTLEQQKVYTVLLMSAPANGSSDSLDIRYITNGTLDNNGTNGRTTTTSSNVQSINLK